MGKDFNVSVGKKIHDERKKKKLSMKQLGEKVNLHESTISRYEKGDIKSLDLEKLREFAKALDVSSEYLLGWNAETKESSSNNSIVGKMLESLRTQRNLSMVELAEELHISVDDLQSYESGIKEVPKHLLKVFADYYNVDINKIRGIEVEAERKHIIVTDNPVLDERYKKWQSAIGYNHFTDEEIDKLIDYAKLLIASRKE